MAHKEAGNIPEINIKKSLRSISEKGFVKTLRKGDTGIGFTLESELGISENNFISHDLTFGHEAVELKAQRKNASSNVTLITKSPHWEPLSAREIIQKYGYSDTSGRQGLKVTLKTTATNPQGLRLELNNSRLNVVHTKDGTICYFLISELMEKVKAKLSKNLLLVLADSKKQRKTEYFHFNEAIFLTALSEQHFKQLLADGTLVFEFRMHIKESGSVRDHGSGFRLNKRHIPSLYEKSVRIL